MLRARKLGVPTPVVYYVDLDTATIYMQRIQGHSMKTILHNNDLDEAAQLELVQSLGRMVAYLHDGGLVHGDLTSSNVLVTPPTTTEGKPSLVLIDFGLSYFSTISEDRAVDLYVLERAFTSAHATSGDALFAACLETYRKTSKNWCSTLNKFAEGEGRKLCIISFVSIPHLFCPYSI